MIAYRVQEQRLGKLGREMRQRLDRLAKGGGEPVRHLKVGTVMVREHKGTLHEVMVVPGGFSWQDKTYPSLSAIALAITGTSWNGPRFFGLRGGRAAWKPRSSEPPVEKDPPRPSTRGSVRSIGAARRSEWRRAGRRSGHEADDAQDRCAARSTPANRPSITSTSPSTRSMRNARPARPM